MKMIKQAPGSEECGACVVAMVTDRTKEEVLKDRPNPAQRDCDWLNYMEELGLVLDDPRDDPAFDRSKPWPEMYNGYLNLPKGSRYYCTIAATLTKIHALAIDEERMVLDPSTSASMEGTWIWKAPGYSAISYAGTNNTNFLRLPLYVAAVSGALPA
jgi:hypothetical protein